MEPLKRGPVEYGLARAGTRLAPSQGQGRRKQRRAGNAPGEQARGSRQEPLSYAADGIRLSQACQGSEQQARAANKACAPGANAVGPQDATSLGVPAGHG